MTKQVSSTVRANKYFMGDVPKDVWTLTNEAAHAASLNEKNKDRPLLNLGQGFFSYSPPRFAIEEAVNALNVPLNNQYSPTRGRPSLLKALAKLALQSNIWGNVGRQQCYRHNRCQRGYSSLLDRAVEPGR